VAAKALETLLSSQKPGGCFGTAPEDPDPSYTTAPSLLALLAHGERRADDAARWLVEWKSPSEPLTEEQRKQFETILRIDVTISGWPSQAGECFATVAPMALACIALRTWGRAGAAERIAAARTT
jgi:hypothetical protein